MRRGGWRKRAADGDGWGIWVRSKPSGFFFKEVNNVVVKKSLQFCYMC